RIASVFPVLDVFVSVAAHITRGGTLDVIGKPLDQLKTLKDLEPTVNHQENQITGNVIYIDNYGNVVTNIPKTLFDKHRRGRDFELWARNHRFTKIHSKYSDILNFGSDVQINKDGEKLAIFNSANLIEIAIYK